MLMRLDEAGVRVWWLNRERRRPQTADAAGRVGIRVGEVVTGLFEDSLSGDEQRAFEHQLREVAEGFRRLVLRQKIQAIRDERTRIRHHLEQTTNQLEAGRQVFTKALALLDDPHGMYQAGNETVRSILNRVFFPPALHRRRQSRGPRTPRTFDILHEAYTIYWHQQKTDGQHSKGQRRTYYRTSGSVAVTSELAAIRNQQALPAGFDTVQTAHGAGLPEESGAAEHPHTATTWKDTSRCLDSVFWPELG